MGMYLGTLRRPSEAISGRFGALREIYGPTHLLYPDRNVEIVVGSHAVSVTKGGWYRADSVADGIHEMTAAPSLAVVPASCRGLRELPPEVVTLTVRDNATTTANFALDATRLNGRCFVQYRDDP